MLLSTLRNLMFRHRSPPTGLRRARLCRRPQRPRLSLEVLEDRTVPSTGPIDVIGHLPVAEYNQFIANALNFQGNPYKDWGNEPTLAVNPLNPNQIAIASFAYGLFVQPGTNSSLWYSTDSGADWGIRFPIAPQPAPGQFASQDQTIAYDSSGTLHGAFLTYSFDNGVVLPQSKPFLNIFHGSTLDPNADGVNGRPASVWQWNPNQVNLYPPSVNRADQPWLALGNGHAYVAYDAYNDGLGAGSVEVRVSASADNGASFTTDNNIDSTNNNGSLSFATNPGSRLATDNVGNVYSIYGWGESPVPKPGEATLLHYRLNMSSDGGQTWKFTSLGGKAGGLDVDDGQSLQLGSSFGGVNRLTGNITAIAADPTGQHIYAVYGKEDASGVDRMWLAEFHPDGSGGLVERANPVALSITGQRSALPSIAVTDNGDIGIQYDTFTDADGQFHVHLATSTDQGQTFTDTDLYDFTATGIPYAFPGQGRLFGDYQDLIAVGNSVFGTFAARGNVQRPGQGIDTTDKIDPFFYSVSLPGGRLSPLASSPVGGTAGSPTGGTTGASATGAGGVMGAAILGSSPFVPLADLSFMFRSGGAAQPGDTGSTADSGPAPVELDSYHVDQLFAAIGQQDPGWMNPASKPHSFGLDEDWLTDVLVGLKL